MQPSICLDSESRFPIQRCVRTSGHTDPVRFKATSLYSISECLSVELCIESCHRDFFSILSVFSH